MKVDRLSIFSQKIICAIYNEINLFVDEIDDEIWVNFIHSSQIFGALLRVNIPKKEN